MSTVVKHVATWPSRWHEHQITSQTTEVKAEQTGTQLPHSASRPGSGQCAPGTVACNAATYDRRSCGVTCAGSLFCQATVIMPTGRLLGREGTASPVLSACGERRHATLCLRHALIALTHGSLGCALCGCATAAIAEWWQHRIANEPPAECCRGAAASQSAPLPLTLPAAASALSPVCLRWTAPSPLQPPAVAPPTADPPTHQVGI